MSTSLEKSLSLIKDFLDDVNGSSNIDIQTVVRVSIRHTVSHGHSLTSQDVRESLQHHRTLEKAAEVLMMAS